MFNTFFLVDTVTIGERHNIGNVAMIPVLQAIHRVGMRNITDDIDRRLRTTVFADRDVRSVFIIENAR